MNTSFDEQKIKIKFEGQTHQIDVKTLTSSLLVFAETLKEINKELDTGKNVDIKIEALKPGSFEIHTIVSAVSNNDLLTTISTVTGIGTAAAGTIAGTYTGLLKLRSWFKKNDNKIVDTKQSEGKTIITAKNGNTYLCENVVYNTYNNSQIINDNISEQFRILEEDSAIEGFTLASDGETFSISKNEFSSLAQKIDILGENKQKITKTSETVYVVKPILEKNTTRRWEFIWNGHRISATVSDTNFLERMEQGEYPFRPGDKMIVDVQINQTLNPAYDAWMNEGYQLTLIHEHIPRESPPKKQGLFDNPDTSI
jgi:hypothetical protein